MDATDRLVEPMAAPRQDQPIRAAEVVGALSLATDLGTGQPLEHALRTAVLAVRLGELAGASAEELADTYYVALLHASGCTSNGHEATQLFGDDIEHRAAFFLIDPTNPAEVLAFYRSHVGAGRPPEVRAQMIEAALARRRPEGPRVVRRRCARWHSASPGGSASPPGIQAALEYVFARWDGRGFPRDVARRRAPAADAPPARGERHLALPHRCGPRRGARSARASRGSRVRPTARRARRAALRTSSSPGWTRRGCGSRRSRASRSRRSGSVGRRSRRRLRRDRGAHRPQVAVAARALDRSGRARRGGRLAAGPTAGLRDASCGGRRSRTTSAGSASRTRSGRSRRPLGFGEWERVRLHPHFTERAFAQSPALAPIGLLAGSHHERLDGSGYHRGTSRAGARPAGAHPRRRRLLRGDARGAAVQAGARRRGRRGGAAARGRGRTARPERGSTPCSTPPATACRSAPASCPAGLTERELEVLLVLVRGRVEPGDRRRSRHLGQDRRAPRPARLPEGRRPQPRRRDGLGFRARPRPRRA